MDIKTIAPWHKASFDRFLNRCLPELLASRLPLAGFAVEPIDTHACRVKISVGDVQAVYEPIPQPDEDGVFHIDDQNVVVLPTASHQELDTAEIRCVGEQLYDFIAERLGQAPADLPWDEALVRSWLPLEAWVREFFDQRHVPAWQRPGQAVQVLDEQNWLSRATHLRRLCIPARKEFVTAGQRGRTCPFETPEGTNIGRILSIARGAEIREGKLVIVDDRPEAALGLSASMIPFLAHCDPNRLLMGANMMRQQMVPDEPEPALVQTGCEPAAEGLWCGRNLLTAFISWGGDTFEDGIVISESAAKRLDYPQPLEPGDKLSTRCGTKGTIARILPDAQMPHLPDGTPVELVFNFIGLHTRLNFGQVLEAVMGRLARAEGGPVIVPPLAGPGLQEIRERLTKAGLNESGMELLTDGATGEKLARPSTVGWVYWGKLCHLSIEKMHAGVRPGEPLNLQGQQEYFFLRDLGAFENLTETYNTKAFRHPDAPTLAERVAAGPVQQAGPPTPAFAELIRQLNAAGIEAKLDGEKLAFRFAPPAGETLSLAKPLPHPWLAQRRLSQIGAVPEIPGYEQVVQANARLKGTLSQNAPESLIQKAEQRLSEALGRLFDALLGWDVPGQRMAPLRRGERVLFSGRTVLSPGPEMRHDQVGLADEIAWTIFAPLVVRQLGDEKQVQQRSKRAEKALDEIMASSWVVLNRAPTIMPTSLLAFHPVRIPDRVIRLYPPACPLMNADFDGDQAAVFLPITDAGQREAGELLSIAAHLRRDPELINMLVPYHESLWGLAALSLTAKGRKELTALLGLEAAAPEGCITRSSLTEALRAVLQRDGVEKTLELLDRLMRRGFEVAKQSGASLSPFISRALQRPPVPAADDDEACQAYAEQTAELLTSRKDFDDELLGPQLLAVKCGARGRMQYLINLLGPKGQVADDSGCAVFVSGGWCEGLPLGDLFACTAGARRALGQLAMDISQAGPKLHEAMAPRGFGVLVRAMRARHPGIVFAHAAATGEADPLTDLDARLFVGLRAR